MIVVTGATGQLGRRIVECLLDRLPPDRIGISVRDPEKAAGFAARGVRVRRGDFEDPQSLDAAFEGAEQLLQVSSNAAAHGKDPLAQHSAAIEAARGAGVGRIVYTSHMSASDTSAFPPSHTHHATEAMLAASGLAWTALRNGFYASSGGMFLGDAPKTGMLAVPADGKVCWTAHDDLAEAAAAVLTGAAGCFDGPTPPLTAAETLDLGDLAKIASDITSRPIQRETVPDDAFRETLAGGGVPPVAVAIAMGFYEAARNGEFAATDPALEVLIGRRPKSMRQVLEDALVP